MAVLLSLVAVGFVPQLAPQLAAPCTGPKARAAVCRMWHAKDHVVPDVQTAAAAAKFLLDEDESVASDSDIVAVPTEQEPNVGNADDSRLTGSK